MDKSQPDPQAFFFEEANPTTSFEFIAPTTKHLKDLNTPPILTGLFSRKSDKSDKPVQGMYALSNKLLVFYVDEFSIAPESVLEIDYTRLVPISTDLAHGFTITKHGVTFEFTTPNKQIAENWVNALRNVCVLSGFHEEYKAIKMIGKGSFAKVYLVEARSNSKQYAVKAFAKEAVIQTSKTNPKATMFNEIDLLRALDHENIIKLHEVHESERSIYLIMELIQGKPLQEPLTKMTFKKDYSQTQIIEMIRSLLDALAYMASKGIMHRDLKPDNILVDKMGKLKIVDFGLATYIDVPEYIFKKCGTPGYIAPEVFKYDQKNANTNYNDRCDVFSAGCILFYMLFGYPLFEGHGASEILRQNREFTEFEVLYTIKKEKSNPDSKVNKDGLDLLLHLLEPAQKKRITSAQALTYAYFNGVPSLTTSDVLRKLSSKDMISSPMNKNSNNIDLLSPLHKFGSMKSEGSPFNIQSHNRFAEKDSLYLDLGKPEMNGKLDTITNGSANNSLLMKGGSNANSNVNSVSAFAKQSTLEDSKSPAKSSRGGHHGAANNQSFLKAAIFNNMQRKNEANTDSPVERGPVRLQIERRHTDHARTKKEEAPEDSHANSARSASSEIDDFGSEECKVQINLEKIMNGTPEKHPSKLFTDSMSPMAKSIK